MVTITKTVVRGTVLLVRIKKTYIWIMKTETGTTTYITVLGCL